MSTDHNLRTSACECDPYLHQPFSFHLETLVEACGKLQGAYNKKVADWETMSPTQRIALDHTLSISKKQAEQACFYINQKLPDHSHTGLRADLLAEIYDTLGQLVRDDTPALEQALAHLAKHCLAAPINPA